MTLLPIPAALIWLLPHPFQAQAPPAGSPDLTSLSLTDVQKNVVEGLKKAGFSIKSAERGKVTNEWIYVTLEVSSPGAPDATVELNEISGDSSYESARCHVYFPTALPESQARARGTALRVKYSNLYASARDSKKSPGAIEVHFSSNKTVRPVTPLTILAEIAMLRRAAAEFVSPKSADEGAGTPSDDLSDMKALLLTENQKAVFTALEKGGYKRVRVTSGGGENQKYVTLDPPSSNFKIFAYVSPQKIRLQRSLDVSDTETQATVRSRPIPEKFPGMTAKVYDLLGRISITLEVSLSDSETTPTRSLDSIAALERGMAFLKTSPTPAPTPTPTDPVGATLKRSGLIYTDIGDFYKLRYTITGAGRAQIVYVRKAVWEYNTLKVQEAFSTFYESDTAPDTEKLRTIFKSYAIGGLVLEAPSANQKYWRIRYKIDVPADCTPERLKKYLGIVSSTADTIETGLGSEDKL